MWFFNWSFPHNLWLYNIVYTHMKPHLMFNRATMWPTPVLSGRSSHGPMVLVLLGKILTGNHLFSHEDHGVFRLNMSLKPIHWIKCMVNEIWSKYGVKQCWNDRPYYLMFLIPPHKNSKFGNGGSYFLLYNLTSFLCFNQVQSPFRRCGPFQVALPDGGVATFHRITGLHLCIPQGLRTRCHRTRCPWEKRASWVYAIF